MPFFLACLTIFSSTIPATAQDPAPPYTWTGSGGDNLYSDGANWADGSVPGYGNLSFGSSTTNTTVDVDTAGLAQHAIFFNSASNYTLTDNGFTFYDYNGYQSRIENDGTGTGTVNVPLTFAAGTTADSNDNVTGRPRAEINAISGDLVFGTAGTITMTGGAVNGLQLFGTGHTVTFNGVISDNGGSRYFEINGGNTAVFNAANTYSGNTDVYNGSTLQFAANGSAANSVIRLGNDDASGVTAGSGANTVSLINATGGQSVSSTLVVVAGSTGLLSSTNGSGTNTYSGGVYLDGSLGISATTAGGTFALANTVDIKSQTLTISGAGVVNVTNGIQSSAGGGTVIYSGSGTLSLNGTGNNAGTTTINSGTLGGTGSVAGPVNINTATINPGAIAAPGTVDAVGTLTTGALTLVGTSTSVFDLVDAGNYDKLIVNGAAALAGTLTINNLGTFANGTTFDLVHGTGLAGTFDGIVNNGFYTFGGQMFEAQYTATDFALVAVPEPATWLAGVLTLLLGWVAQRRRMQRG